ncbi:MAG: hypothetical protein M1821_002714 [Bathelium mastoideum]|nr:MAG: hypothetical protein M1821_002714 [Bathelium mastoideum]
MTSDYSPPSTPVWLSIVLGVAGGVIGSVILPILLTAVYIYLHDIWTFMIKDRESYLQWNRLRKEWNRVAALEKRRQLIMCAILSRECKKRCLTEEARFYYGSLTQDQNNVFPGEKLDLTSVEAQISMAQSPTDASYYKDYNIKVKEWKHAKARATGQPGNEMAFFASMMECSNPQHTPNALGSFSGSRPNGQSGVDSSQPSTNLPSYEELIWRNDIEDGSVPMRSTDLPSYKDLIMEE